MARITWKNVTAGNLPDQTDALRSANRMFTEGAAGIGDSLQAVEARRQAQEAAALTNSARANVEAMVKGTYDIDQARRAILDQVTDPNMRNAMLTELGNVPAEFQTATDEGNRSAAGYADATGIASTLEESQRELNLRMGSDSAQRLYTEASDGKFEGYSNPVDLVLEKIKAFGGDEGDISTQASGAVTYYNDIITKLKNENGGKMPFPPELVAQALANSYKPSWDFNFFTAKGGANLDKSGVLTLLKPFSDPEQVRKMERQRQAYVDEQTIIDNSRGALEKYKLRLSVAESRGDTNEIARIQKNIDTLATDVVKYRNGGADPDETAKNAAAMDKKYPLGTPVPDQPNKKKDNDPIDVQTVMDQLADAAKLVANPKNKPDAVGGKESTQFGDISELLRRALGIDPPKSAVPKKADPAPTVALPNPSKPLNIMDDNFTDAINRLGLGKFGPPGTNMDDAGMAQLGQQFPETNLDYPAMGMGPDFYPAQQSPNPGALPAPDIRSIMEQIQRYNLTPLIGNAGVPR